MNSSNPLAQEITAQIQLGLFGTVGTLARQLRSIDRIAPRLKEGGLVRRIQVDRDQQRRALGLSVAHRKISAFGGLLYCVGAMSHELVTQGADITHTDQQSMIDVGDMTLLEADRRLQWKTYQLVYDLLEDIFAGDTLPDIILLDIPFIMGRRVYAQALDDQETDEELRSEVSRLRDRLENFWDRYIDRCYPFAADGPKIVTLARGRFGSLLRLIKAKGQEISPDPIDSEVENLIKTEWVRTLSVGIDRVLRGILLPEHRTAAFDIDLSEFDRMAFPQALIRKGSMGLHYLTGLRGQPVQVETLGAASVWQDCGGAEVVDELVADLMALTYFDQRHALPLSLWYAQHGVEIVKKKGLLEFYKRETLHSMREEQVDQAWLAGWEEE